jgi:hypothetical protein
MTKLFRKITLAILTSIFILTGVVWQPKNAHAAIPGVGPFGGVILSTTKCSISCGSFWRGRVYQVFLSPQNVVVPIYVSNRAKIYDYKQRSSGTFVLGKSKLDPRQFTCARRRGWKCRSVPAVSWVTDIGTSKTIPSLADIQELAQEFLQEFLETVVDSFEAALKQMAEMVISDPDLSTATKEQLGEQDVQEKLEDIIDEVLQDTAKDVFGLFSGDPSVDLIKKIEDQLPTAIGAKLKGLLGENVSNQIEGVIKAVFSIVVYNTPKDGSLIATYTPPDLSGLIGKVSEFVSLPKL